MARARAHRVLRDPMQTLVFCYSLNDFNSRRAAPNRYLLGLPLAMKLAVTLWTVSFSALVVWLVAKKGGTKQR